MLHSFNDSDGAYPQSGLVVDSSGNLYGATFGGASGGTVFELSPAGNSWTYKVLHNFQPGEAASLRTWLSMQLETCTEWVTRGSPRPGQHLQTDADEKRLGVHQPA